MKVVALISGGKDSTYNMMQCIAAGHEIVALANLFPKNKTEIDSYMYQSVGFEAIDFIAKAMDLPLFQKETMGISKERGKVYNVTRDDEVEDLFDLLQEVKEKISVDAVSVGAILSDYQRVRVENVCSRLGLVPLAYLWQRNQEELLDEMIKCEVDAVLVKVAALGLDPTKHLGRSLSSLQSYLLNLHEKYGINVCGEGGEYETLTIDCPLFKHRIIIENSETILHSKDAFAPVGFLKLNKLKQEQKKPVLNLSDRLRDLPLKDCDGYVTDQGEDVKELNEDELDNDCTIESAEPLNTTVPYSSAKQNLSVHEAGNGWLCIGGVRGEVEGNPMENAISKLMLSLSRYKQDLTNVCAVTVYISDMKFFAQINEAYVKHFNFPNPPTRACVEVPLSDECPVLLDAISWKTLESHHEPPVERFTMHVQSRSHWAPANIGPYSQVVKIGEIAYLAGQIGMIPGNLEMVEGGVKSQSRLAMRHIERLLKASDPNMNLRNVVQGVCYVTNLSSVQQVRKIWEENTNNAIVDYVVVSNLPKSALVEWHVWAHKYNHMFEYEETGKCIEDANWSISIYKRWNPEDNIVAIVYHLEKTIPTEESTFNREIFVEFIDYALQKLDQANEENSKAVHNLKIFYPTSKNIDCREYYDYLDELRKDISLTYTFIPVIYCKDENTFLSICGTRTE